MELGEARRAADFFTAGGALLAALPPADFAGRLLAALPVGLAPVLEAGFAPGLGKKGILKGILSGMVGHPEMIPGTGIIEHIFIIPRVRRFVPRSGIILLSLFYRWKLISACGLSAK